MNNYYEDESGELFENPIVANHKSLTKLTMAQYKDKHEKLIGPLDEADYMAKAQNVMDEQAQSMGYDNIFTMISYVGDPLKKFNDEGQKALDYRSRVWQHSNKLMAQVLAGKVKQPTTEEYTKGLPGFTL